MYDMKPSRPLGGILSVRLSAPAMRRLRGQARKQKRTPSALVREMLERELSSPDPDSRSVYERTKGWIGAASGDAPNAADLRKAMETWNPDRRG